MEVRKAILPAAGFGTRFLPATKAMPKEMLPIVDKPIIQYVVEEALAAGIEDVLIVTGRGKRSIEDHFDRSIELEVLLHRAGKNALLKEVERISQLIDVYYVRQKEPLGVADAIYAGRRHIGNEPFAVMLGDDVLESRKPAIKQLIDAFRKRRGSVVGVAEVPLHAVSRFGVVKGRKLGEGTYELEEFVEKPSPERAPSRMVACGRYVFTPEIFDAIERTPVSAGGERLLPQSVMLLAGKRRVYAKVVEGKWHAVGEKVDLLESAIEFALKRSDTQRELRAYLRELAKKDFKP